MPITPFHYPIAKIIQRFGGKASLSLPALLVGAMVPDLEVPVVYLAAGTEGRLVLHSLLGGGTLGTLIAVALTVLAYPAVVSKIFRVDRAKVKTKCRLTPMLVVCCLIGCLSHVLLDVANHNFNPLLWPFLSLYQTPSPIVPLLGGPALASLIVHSAMALLFVGLVFRVRQNFWEYVLVE